MGHTALQLRNQDQTRVCPNFLPNFADADAEGGGGTSLAENNLDPRPSVMGGPGSLALILPFLAHLLGNSRGSEPSAASERGAVLPVRVI